MIELLSKFQCFVPCFDYINYNTSYFSPLEAKSNEKIALGTFKPDCHTNWRIPQRCGNLPSTVVLDHSLIVRAAGSCRAVIIIIINTVSVMFDNYDWRMMLKLLGVSSYRRRIKADKRLKGGAKTMYVLVG